MIVNGSHVEDIRLSRPAAAVFPVIAEAEHAIRMAPSVVHVEYRARAEDTDLIERWVLDGGQLRSWRARRFLDPDRGVVRFEHQSPQSPILRLVGEWRVTRSQPRETVVQLRHEWTVQGDDTLVRERMQRGTRAQLEGIRKAADLDVRDVTYRSSRLVEGRIGDVENLLLNPRPWSALLPAGVGAQVVAHGPDWQLVDFRTDGGTEVIRRIQVRLPVVDPNGIAGVKLAWKDLGALPDGTRVSWGHLLLRPVDSAVLVSSVRSMSHDAGAAAKSPLPDPLAIFSVPGTAVAAPGFDQPVASSPLNAVLG